MNKKYEKYCPGCGKTYESDTPEFEGTVLERQEIIDAEYEQALADGDAVAPRPILPDAEANEEPRPFKQMQGKKWTGKKEYMNDYIPPTDIKDIGKE